MKITTITATLPAAAPMARMARTAAMPREIEITVLEPDGDLWLTQTAEEQQRVFSKKVYLGQEATADGWTECDGAYKAACEAEFARKMEEGSNQQ